MKWMKSALALILVLFGVLVSAPALAWHHGHDRFGVFIGAPIFPWYYPPYPYYYPPAVAVPAAPPTYVEQGSEPAQAPAQQPQGYWYYCADAKAYYPYVKECSGGWQRVVPQPPQGG
jgi:hypothetical protein